MQDKAPEALIITVQAVNASATMRPYEVISQGGSVKVTDVTMTAKVDVVLRATSNVHPGSVITIHYVVTEYRPHGLTGPHPPAIPNVGDRAAAYLLLDNAGAYKLAAEGESILKQ
jgi:hypothetical protein